MSWNKDATKIVVTGGDNSIHVINPLTSEELWTGKDANSSPRGFRAVFCGELIVSVGFARFPFLLLPFLNFRNCAKLIVIEDLRDKYVYMIYLLINQSIKLY